MILRSVVASTAFVVLFFLSALAQADLINEGDRCIPIALSFSNFSAFQSHRFALIDPYFRDEEPPSATHSALPIEDGSPIKRDEFGFSQKLLLAIPIEITSNVFSRETLGDAKIARSLFSFGKLQTCFPKGQPGNLEANEFRVEHVDAAVGLKMIRRERLDKEGRVVLRFHPVPTEHVFEPPAKESPGDDLSFPVTLITLRDGTLSSRAVGLQKPFSIQPWPVTSVLLGPPPPAGVGPDWSLAQKEHFTRWPLDGLHSELVPEGSIIQRATIHWQLDPRDKQPSARQMLVEGHDAEGRRYVLDYNGRTSLIREPDRWPRWFAVSAVLLAAGALALKMRPRRPEK